MTTLEFNALVRQYQGLVYTVCHQLVPDEGDAQDLAQETFLAAWRAIDRCPPGYEKQWLARIASNKAKDYLCSAWVRRVNTPGDDILALEGAPPGSDPEQQVLDAMSEETLTEKILGMREPYRTPCRLMLLEGRTAAEAAALCGRPQKTVEAQRLILHWFAHGWIRCTRPSSLLRTTGVLTAMRKALTFLKCPPTIRASPC